MALKKKSAKKAAKPAAAKKSRSGFEESGHGRNPNTGRLQFTSGKTTSLGVTQAWIHIFEKNEKASRSQKMTDKQIADFMLKEFPGHNSKLFQAIKAGTLHKVQAQRAKYNRGGMSPDGEPPEIQSHRYDEEGKPADPKFSGKSGVTLDQLDERFIIPPAERKAATKKAKPKAKPKAKAKK